MLGNRTIVTLFAGLIGVLCIAALMTGAVTDTRVADAAMKGDKEAVRTLVKQAVDVNAAQGDGMTALHWAAKKGDLETVQTLIYAGANVKAATRLGSYTALFMAAEGGYSQVIEALLKAGADAKSKAVTGITPLMMAAMSGDAPSVKRLLDGGADANAREAERGQTALSFAAAFNRPDAIKTLLASGANPNIASKTVQPLALTQLADGGGAVPVFNQNAAAKPKDEPAQAGARGQRGAAAPAEKAAVPANGQTPANGQAGQQQAQQGNNNGADAGSKGGGNPKAGLTPLMYAARQGNIEAAVALLDGSGDINAKSADESTALLLATINGHFDLAKMLIDRGADVNIVSMDGATPLYGVVNTQWARKSFHPQPTTRYEKISYLDLMAVMLDKGVNPNARLKKELWYSEYNFSLESASAAGTTAFWKCAEVGDIDGMQLLVSRGADPNLSSNDNVTPLLMATGAGVHGNDDITAPTGRLKAVKYLVEELHADVNAADTGGNSRVGVNAGNDMQAQQPQPPQQPAQQAAQQPAQQASQQSQQAAGQPAPANGQTLQQTIQQGFGGARPVSGGFTALHNAAARGDNEMILYLVSKGAKVDAVSKGGTTVVDMANGPRQRIQPYPETVALLEMLGSPNSHKCVSC